MIDHHQEVFIILLVCPGMGIAHGSTENDEKKLEDGHFVWLKQWEQEEEVEMNRKERTGKAGVELESDEGK